MSKPEKVLTPSTPLLCKLGSALVHVEEMLSHSGSHFDVETLKAIVNDEEVQVWLFGMAELALLPVKR